MLETECFKFTSKGMIWARRARPRSRPRLSPTARSGCSSNSSDFRRITSPTQRWAKDLPDIGDFFPAPQGWGCPPCWGFAKVVESHASDIATGSRYYGYFPIAETLDVLPAKVSGSGFTDGAPHRANKAAVYNRYLITTADPLYDPEFEPEQVLLRPTFASGWWLADFIHQGKPAAVVMSSASSKSAIATASQLRNLSAITGSLPSRRSETVPLCAIPRSMTTYSPMRASARCRRPVQRPMPIFSDAKA